MAVHTFKPVPAWGRVGQLVRLGSRTGTIPATLPGGGDATLTQGGTVKVGYVDVDANGMIPEFTTVDIATVILHLAGQEHFVHSLEAINAGAEAAAAAANSATAADASRVAAENAAADAVVSVAGKVDKGANVVNVREHGAIGDGSTLDTAAINAAIQANPGRTIRLTNGALGASIYLIDATANIGQKGHPVGIQLNEAGTSLVVDPGVTVKVQANSSARYSAVEVTAADCVIEGGTWLGDVGTHTGATGEQGYGINVNSGGDRCKVRNVRATKFWGDGFVLGDGDSFSGGSLPADVEFVNCVADDNRRQGLSIIAGIRPKIIGGSYINTGATSFTAPGAGVAVEPNPGGTQYVQDFLISGVTCAGNKGRGLYIHGQGNVCSGTVIGVRATGNLTDGIAADSSTSKVEFIGCHAGSNTGSGWALPATLGPTKLTACTSTSNSSFGFLVASDRVEMTGCTSSGNVRSGYYLDPAALLPKLKACESVGDCTGAGSYVRSFEVRAPNSRLIACEADPGSGGATIGFAITATSTGSRVVACDTRGTFATAAYQGQVDTFTFPIPGVAKQTGVAVTAAGVHAALVSLGIITA